MASEGEESASIQRDGEETGQKELPRDMQDKTIDTGSTDIKVTVLKEGYCHQSMNGQFRADGTITLIQSDQCNIVVDTGGPWDKQYLLDELSKAGLRPGDLNYVVCTHGHSDHVGNLNLFPDAIHIVGWDICQGDLYRSHPFTEGQSYIISDSFEVMPTPGHTHNDVSLLVKSGGKIIVVAGDLFECEDDVWDPSIWKECSEDPETQQRNRTKILQLADVIVPGHGPHFLITDRHRNFNKCPTENPS